jgi:hypothetical protein
MQPCKANFQDRSGVNFSIEQYLTEDYKIIFRKNRTIKYI